MTDNPFLDLIISRALRIGLITIISIVGYFGLRYAIRILTINIQRLDKEDASEFDFRTETVLRFVRSVGIVVIVIVTLLTVLGELQINVAPLLASVGVAGLALGLGAQTLVRDAIAGLFILMEDQFHVGDVITVAGISGTVEELNLRTTHIRNLNGTLHIIPNGEIRIVSNSSMNWSRARIEILIPHEEDIEQVISLLQNDLAQLATQPDYASDLLEPFSVSGPEELTDWGQRVRILAKVKAGQQWGMQRQLRRYLLEFLATNNISIAKPRSEVVIIHE
ncbi:MAG TPA: mechanosensitive ion channel family protein [Anaerolineae bacterium]|nr:mechanosensitive ion channel family protein [Anaerolineae bacterium]